jgi:hypothetical protein
MILFHSSWTGRLGTGISRGEGKEKAVLALRVKALIRLRLIKALT